MPFAPNGVYTPPAGATTAAPGDVIRSATWNAIFTDLASALTVLGEQVLPTGTVNVLGPINVGGTTTTQPTNQTINSEQTITGPPYDEPHHSFGINNFVSHVSASDHSVSTVKILNDFGGTGYTGVSSAVHVENVLATATAVGGTDSQRFYVGLDVTTQAAVEDHGTAPTPKGFFYGLFPSVTNANVGASGIGATYPRALVSVQGNVFTWAGTGAYVRVGIESNDNGSVVQGTAYDAAYSVTASAGAVGWKYGILIAPTSDRSLAYNYSPMNANGILFGTLGVGTVTSGINWSSYTFTGNQIAGNGWTVGSTGNATFPNLLGTTAAGNAVAGGVGEVIESTVAFGSAVSLTTNTVANVTSITLSAGDWDVWGLVGFAPNAATTSTYFGCGISLTSATFPTVPNAGAVSELRGLSFSAGNCPTMPAGSRRINVAAPTTVYLVSVVTFAVNTMATYGYIGARRRR